MQNLKFLFQLKSDKAFYNAYISGTGWQEGMTGDLAKIAFDLNYRFSLNSFNTIVNVFIILGFLPFSILLYYFIRGMREEK